MHKSNVILLTLAGFWVLAVTVRAQEAVVYSPPAPVTKLEMLETNTGTILIKSTALVGSMSVNGATVSVTCKADTELSTGRKEYGIVIGLLPARSARLDDRTVVDYDEVDSLLNALDVLAKMDWSVTSWPSFDATYHTTARFRVAAFSGKASARIEYSLRNGRMNKGLVITASQLQEFRGLIDQAKRKIDEVRAK